MVINGSLSAGKISSAVAQGFRLRQRRLLSDDARALCFVRGLHPDCTDRSRSLNSVDIQLVQLVLERRRSSGPLSVRALLQGKQVQAALLASQVPRAWLAQQAQRAFRQSAVFQGRALQVARVHLGAWLARMLNCSASKLL
jgi:hypothetical protein